MKQQLYLTQSATYLVNRKRSPAIIYTKIVMLLQYVSATKRKISIGKCSQLSIDRTFGNKQFNYTKKAQIKMEKYLCQTKKNLQN